MKEDNFIRQNAGSWRLLENYLKTLQSKGIKKLNKDQLNNFMDLYNLACSHLSYSQTNFGETQTTLFLNRLVASAHGYIYTTPKSPLKKLLIFYTVEFPLMLSKYKAYIITAGLLMLFGGILSFILSAINPDNASVLFAGADKANFNGPENFQSLLESSFITTNNIGVGIKAFALGITACIGSIFILFYNGIPLGTLCYYAFVKAKLVEFWSLILPHGILELFSIFVCGAAGLLIGFSLWYPGNLSRKDALIQNSQKAILLVLGTIPLFIIAGTIEGFFTPRHINPWFKLLFSLVTLIALTLYVYLPNKLMVRKFEIKN